MRNIDVTFTTDAYSSDFDGSYELNVETREALASRVSTVLVDGNPITLQSAAASCDDTVYAGGKDEDGNVKLFVNVVLRMAFASEDEAQGYEPDEAVNALLGEVDEAMLEGGDIEATWEVLQVEALVPTPEPRPI